MSASSAGTLGVFHPRRLVFDPREDRRLYLFLAAVYVLAIYVRYEKRIGTDGRTCY